MTWRAIDSVEVLRDLLTCPVVGVRMVCLDADPSVDLAAVLVPPSFGDTEQQIAAWRSAPFAKRLELSVRATDPASVVVVDATAGKIVGAYVWAGARGPVANSRDDRVIQLADAIEAEYRGKPSPVVEWLEPDLVAAAEAPAFSVEQDLGEGVRAAMEGMTIERMLDMIGECCTCEQCSAFQRLILKKKHVACGLVNMRFTGGRAVQEVCPLVEDRFGQQWLILPSGVTELAG